MEDHVYLLRSYLPVEFEEEDANEFIQYLTSAYIENLLTQKYQFSFTAFHMLYMSYVYKIKWFLKEQGDIQIDKSIQDFISANKGVSFNTLFDLSQQQEKSSLGNLLKSLSFHANDIDLCKNLVEVRNKCVHASGKVYFKRSSQVENYILEEIDNIKSIQKKFKVHLKALFEKFIESKWEDNWLGDDLRQWIINNYLSQQDIIELLSFKPSFLKADSDCKEIVFKKLLYIVLVSELVRYLDVKEDYLLKSLTTLTKGLTGQIDIRKNTADSPKMKNTQELIEEKILPLLQELPNEDFLRAQKILNLEIF